jgi:hypothetical protein
VVLQNPLDGIPSHVVSEVGKRPADGHCAFTEAEATTAFGALVYKVDAQP